MKISRSLGLLALAASSMMISSAFAGGTKIGFLLSTMQEERYQKDKSVFEATITKLGGETVFSSANNNEQTQAAEMDNLLSKGVKVIVLQPVNGDTAASLVKQAKKDNVQVIAYDRLIKNAPIAAYITKDSYKVGVIQAEAAAKATNGKGNYIILMGQAGHSVADAITKGNLDTLAKYPGIKVVVKQNHQGWSPELAMKTVENALTSQKNNVQAILANNSGMANGAVRALEEQKLAGKVFVAGSDADLATIQNIVQGKQALEVLAPFDELASKAAQTAMDLANGKAIKGDTTVDNGSGMIQVVSTPVYAIDKNNIEERIIKTGFHPRDKVYVKTMKAKK